MASSSVERWSRLSARAPGRSGPAAAAASRGCAAGARRPGGRSAACRSRRAARAHPRRSAAAWRRQAERLEQRARRGSRWSASPALRRSARGSDRGRHRAPERLGRVGKLRRDLLHQLRRTQLPHRFFRVARIAGSCSTPRAAAPARCGRSRGDGSPIASRIGAIDRELEPRREHDGAQHPDRDPRGSGHPGSPMHRIRRASRSARPPT